MIMWPERFGFNSKGGDPGVNTVESSVFVGV